MGSGPREQHDTIQQNTAGSHVFAMLRLWLSLIGLRILVIASVLVVKIELWVEYPFTEIDITQTQVKMYCC